MRPPNILIFMTDHQRADTALPEHPCRTPHLDRFARDSVTFTQAYCPSPHCCPSRATFFSGLYPTRHGVWNNICNDQALSRGVKPGTRLFGDDLAAAGYLRDFCGKWHVSVTETPADRGWTQHSVSGHKSQEHGQPWAHYEKQATQPEPTERGEGGILRPGYGHYRLYGTGAEAGNAHDERTVNEALEVLAARRGSDRPWCLYVGCIAPHDPYFPPPRHLAPYRIEDVPLPPSFHDALADKPRVYQRLRAARFGQLGPREVREGIRHFWAYCSYLDELFGRVLAGLDATGQAEDTLVLYCSDHGDYCGEHGLFAKGIPCFRGAYHVPAIIRWPAGLCQPGRRVDEFVSLADFAPTFADVAGQTPDPRLTGRSLRPFLRGESPADWRDEMHTQCNGVELYYTQRSVMTRDWKYVFNGFDHDELYDRRSDPDEMRNLAAEPAYAPVVRAMCRRLWRFAHREDDAATNSYITVGLAPHGPAAAFWPE